MKLTDLLTKHDLEAVRAEQGERLREFEPYLAELAMRAAIIRTGDPVRDAFAQIQTMLFLIDRALSKKLGASRGAAN